MKSSLSTLRAGTYLLLMVLGAVAHAQDLTISGATYGSGQTQTIGATNTITTSGAVTVSSGANITYQAGATRISLEPGFTASSGSYFHAIIAPDTQAPTVPTGLYSSNIVSTSFSLGWSAASDAFGVTVYEVQKSSGSGYTSIGTFSGLSALVSSLNPATTYSMQVRSRDAAGNWSAWSTVLTVTTGAATQPDGGNQNELNVHIP